MEELLKDFAEEMQKLNINYDFMEWKSFPIPYPFFVGQYFEDNYIFENNTTEGQLLVVGWDINNSYSNLIKINKQIKKHFADYKKVIGNKVISIAYDTSDIDYAENNELKKIEIRLDFSLWEGD